MVDNLELWLIELDIIWLLLSKNLITRRKINIFIINFSLFKKMDLLIRYLKSGRNIVIS